MSKNTSIQFARNTALNKIKAVFSRGGCAQLEDWETVDEYRSDRVSSIMNALRIEEERISNKYAKRIADRERTARELAGGSNA